MIAFVLAYVAAVPFMNTSLFEGPIAEAWHGADIAYFVNLLAAALMYGGYRCSPTRRRISLPIHLRLNPPPFTTTDFQGFVPSFRPRGCIARA